jgi:hypothetical protein
MGTDLRRALDRVLASLVEARGDDLIGANLPS